MSAGTRIPIVAIVLTLIFFPIYNSVGNLLGHGIRLGDVNTINCNYNRPIPNTAAARRLGIVGAVCNYVIVRRITLTKTGYTIRVGEKTTRRR